MHKDSLDTQTGAATKEDTLSSILVKYCLDGSWHLILSFY